MSDSERESISSISSVSSNSSNSSERKSQSEIDDDVNALQIAISSCNNCPIDLSSRASNGAVSPSFSKSKSRSSHSSHSTKSGESIAQEKIAFMIETMEEIFPESEGFYVNHDYDDDAEIYDNTEIEFFVSKNTDVENKKDLCLNFYFYPNKKKCIFNADLHLNVEMLPEQNY